VIARREGDDTPLTLVRQELEKPVRRTPQFEGAAGLNALALQPDSPSVDLTFDERSSLNEAFDTRRRFRDIAGGDLRGLD
jgi:hypothetical protein